MPKTTSPPTTRRAVAVRSALILLFLAVGVYILATHRDTVLASLHTARGASIPWLVTSIGLMLLTYCLAAGIYGVLALHPLRFWQTLLVEVAASFVNRLLPAGLGGLGLHGVYLYKRKHKPAEAAVVVSVNNLIGMAAHLILLALAISWYPAVLSQLHTGGISVSWQFLATVFAAIVFIALLPPARHRLGRVLRNLWVSVRKLEGIRIAKAFGLAALLTITYTLILFSSARSLGLHLGLLQIFIVFSLGMLASTATPTPGGLVGAEAGLFAGFVAYGVTIPLAGGTVVLYRLITYWLPLVPGLGALLLARRRTLV